MSGAIYCLKNKISGKKYIGQTIDLKERMREHRKDARQGRKGVDSAINKYGWDKFEVVILEENISEEDLTRREKYWINKYNTFKGEGYNLTNGEDAMRGEDNFMYGREPTNKGTTLTEEERKKVSEWTKGNTPSGSDHPLATLTVKEAREILKYRIENKIGINRLAKKFDRASRVVGRIINGDHWTIEEGNLDYLVEQVEEDLRKKVTKEICSFVIQLKKDGMKYCEFDEKLKERFNLTLGRTTLINIVKRRHPLSKRISK